MLVGGKWCLIVYSDSLKELASCGTVFSNFVIIRFWLVVPFQMFIPVDMACG